MIQLIEKEGRRNGIAIFRVCAHNISRRIFQV